MTSRLVCRTRLSRLLSCGFRIPVLSMVKPSRLGRRSTVSVLCRPCTRWAAPARNTHGQKHNFARRLSFATVESFEQELHTKYAAQAVKLHINDDPCSIVDNRPRVRLISQ